MSQAEYTSFIGDDDWVAPDYVAKVMAALETGPDYVGYKIRYTSDGRRMMPVEHRLSHGNWWNTAEMLYRDIGIHNPIRRELALLATWAQDHQDADVTWARNLRATGKVKTEVWIPEEMYYYQETTSAAEHAGRSWTYWGGGVPQPMPESEILPVPEYHWLTVRDEAFA
jgi:hypothetical protein